MARDVRGRISDLRIREALRRENNILSQYLTAAWNGFRTGGQA
jgi:hypothetical protein